MLSQKKNEKVIPEKKNKVVEIQSQNKIINKKNESKGSQIKTKIDLSTIKKEHEIKKNINNSKIFVKKQENMITEKNNSHISEEQIKVPANIQVNNIISSKIDLENSSFTKEKNVELDISNTQENMRSFEYFDKTIKNDYISDLMNNSRNRLKNYSGLMDIINFSLSDIKNILNEELEKNKEIYQAENEIQEIFENIHINNHKRTHKIIKSCYENDLETIRKEIGLNYLTKSRINSRNKVKIKVMDKLYMTTIDENEEKNIESYDQSDCSSIQENVIIHLPKGGKLFKNIFSKILIKNGRSTPKIRNSKLIQNKSSIKQTDCTEKTTNENDFLEKETYSDINTNIVFNINQSIRNERKLSKKKIKTIEALENFETNIINDNKTQITSNISFNVEKSDNFNKDQISQDKLTNDNRCLIN